MEIKNNLCEIEEYQLKSLRTVNLDNDLLCEFIIGANGELGEVTDILKKYLFQGHDLNKDHLIEELGDVMFYLVNLATILKIDFREILAMNITKLKKRYPEGFNKNESINRG